MLESRELKRYFVPVSYDLAALGASAENAAREISEHVKRRGAFVLPDGQILRQEIAPDQISDFFSYDDLEPPSKPTPRRSWTPEHAAYFGLEDPFQVSDGPETYGYPSVMVDFSEPYLDDEEQILAIVHAEKDGRYYYCTCHEAQVVYTNRWRVLCMVCGALHCVLRTPISIPNPMKLTTTQWFALFGDDNEFLDDEVEVCTVDFQEIEQADRLWETDRYVEAAREVTFFARATPEEFKRYRGSIITPGLLIEAGFQPLPAPPPPVAQVGQEFALDLIDNAATSLRSGASAYIRSRTEPGEIKHAVLDLFHVVELILKARLSELEPSALKKQPNNPQVLALLQGKGVTITAREIETITQLRRLRNALQHGHAEMEYRGSRRILRGTIEFLDHFVYDELDLWIGDVIDARDWWRLLRIPALRDHAQQHAEAILAELDLREHDVSSCPQCGRETLIRTFMQGSICAFCQYRPRIEDLMPEEFPEFLTEYDEFKSDL
ncbi:MAG: hypothetical protein AB1941_21610 [Gemmatimonadota bacterium]